MAKFLLSLVTLSALAALPTEAAILLTENFEATGTNTQPNQTVTRVADFPSFQAVQLTGGGDGIGTGTASELAQLPGSSNWAYFNTSNGNYMAAFTDAFTITEETTELTLEVDLGRRTNFGEGRYILGFVQNYNGSVRDEQGNINASPSGTSVSSFTLGGVNGQLFGAIEIQKSAIPSGEFLLNQFTSYTSVVGAEVRAVLIFDNTGGGFQQGNFDNFSLAAVPEPSTFGLLGAATLGLASMRRRRRA
jgi:hypothetical protein